MKITQKIQETFQSLKRNFSQGIFIYDSSLAKSQDGDYVIHSPNPVWQSFRKGLMMGFGIMLGMFGTGVIAVAVTGTIKTWTANEKLTASDLNTTIASLRTAIEGITSSQWTTSGSNLYYNTGNVGIGMSSPGYSGDTRRWLHIKHSSQTSIRQEGSSLITDWGVTSGGDWGYLFTRTAHPLLLGTNDIGRMTIASNGNVGIGTTNPGYTLHVNGSIAGVGAYNALSDGRYKENIQNIFGALDKIEKLRGVTYTWKNKEYKELKFKEGQDLGFIGQEVEKVIPEAVSKDEKGILSLAYSNLIPVIVEAVKELKRNQNDKNEDLSLRLSSVTENLKSMTEENLVLKKQLSELRKENHDVRQKSLSFEERLKALEENRYAKK